MEDVRFKLGLVGKEDTVGEERNVGVVVSAADRLFAMVMDKNTKMDRSVDGQAIFRLGSFVVHMLNSFNLTL